MTAFETPGQQDWYRLVQWFWRIDDISAISQEWGPCLKLWSKTGEDGLWYSGSKKRKTVIDTRIQEVECEAWVNDLEGFWGLNSYKTVSEAVTEKKEKSFDSEILKNLLGEVTLQTPSRTPLSISRGRRQKKTKKLLLCTKVSHNYIAWNKSA